MNLHLHQPAGWSLLAVITGLLVAPMQAQAVIRIEVSSLDLPVGGSRIVELYLDPEIGEISAAGLTVVYDPAQLSVSFAGINHAGLGGGAAVHLVRSEPGRIVLAAARPGGGGYTLDHPELFARLKVTRLVEDLTFLVFSDAFTAPGGIPVTTPVALMPILFGFVPEDSDDDQMPDPWELSYFPDLETAGEGTDFDGDGEDDLAEYRAGSNPRIPYLVGVPEVNALREHPASLHLHVLMESNVLYRLQQTTSLAAPSWQRVLFTVPAEGNLPRESTRGAGAEKTLEVPWSGKGPLYFRIRVAE